MRICLKYLSFLVFLLAACSDTSTNGPVDGSSGVRDRGINPQPDRGGEGGDMTTTDGGEGDSSVNDLAGDGTTGDDTSTEDGPTVSDSGRIDEGLCDGESIAYTGTHVLDFNQENLEINDRLKITVYVTADPPVEQPVIIAIRSTNVSYLEGTVRQYDDPFSGAEFRGGGVLDLRVDRLATTQFNVEAEVITDTDLISVFVELQLVGAGCTIPRSHSGAILQVIGGEFKIPYCVDMAQYRSLQVAPFIQKRNLDHYAERNGIRDDLWVDEFIFCAESPTIVHTAEFCIRSEPDQAVSFAGTYDGDAWTVDDFMLVEVFNRGALVADGFTSQNHPGRDTFYCAPTEENLCGSGCTAELTVIDEDRQIDALAIASAEDEMVGGELVPARTFARGEVEITSLLSADGSDRTIRVTALDAGEVGELKPQLYLVSEDPE